MTRSYKNTHVQTVISLIREHADLSMLPWQEKMTLEPIRQLLNATGQDQENRIQKWKDAKLAELHFFGLTVSRSMTPILAQLLMIERQSALVAAALCSAFSWNIFRELFPFVEGLWFSALILVLTSVGVAMQQSTALYRLSSNSDGMDALRRSLGYYDGQQLQPRKIQVFIWQTSGLLLNGSIALFGLGLLLQIWIDCAKNGQKVEVRHD